ncbi:MAG: hypothetical protein DMG39_01675 [Acidobacteria bacterium]|nr:MAG: hypothetical protein DMG39_01675 [Acidobacteriota bacterium]
MAVGTIAFMSPEPARGKELDVRSDLFSFGAVLYQMATSKHPFEGESAATIFDGILNRIPASPAELNPVLALSSTRSSAGRSRRIATCATKARRTCARN